MHCFVLFGNEEFAGAGVIKTCCCAKEKTHFMPLLFVPVGQWKAVEVFSEARGKPVFQRWHRWCPGQQGFTPAQLQWGDTAQLFLGQLSWFGGWKKLPLCSVCSGPCACAGHNCSHHVRHGSRKFPPGIPSRQPLASPDLSPVPQHWPSPR